MQGLFSGANKENNCHWKEKPALSKPVSYLKKSTPPHPRKYLGSISQNRQIRLNAEQIHHSIWDTIDLEDEMGPKIEIKSAQTEETETVTQAKSSEVKKSRHFYKRKCKGNADDERIVWRQKQAKCESRMATPPPILPVLEEMKKNNGIELRTPKRKNSKSQGDADSLKKSKWKRKSGEPKEELEQKKENMGTVSEADVDKILSKCQHNETQPFFVLYMETIGGPVHLNLPKDFSDSDGLATWIVHNVHGVETSSFMQAAIAHYVRNQLKTLFS